MSTFTRGMSVFWRTELRVAVSFLAMIVAGGLMIAALLLAVAGAFWGFWLCSNPAHTPWWLVWLSRGSAMVWLLFITCALYRHILRLGTAS